MDASKGKKKFSMPDTYVIIVALMIIAAIVTWLLPAGTYDTIEGSKMIDPNTYHLVESKPCTPMGFLNSFYGGLAKGSSTIFLVFLIGGAFEILTDTGSIDAMLNLVVKKSKGNLYVIIPVIYFTMCVLGALGVGNNVALAFAPLCVLLCKKLKLDPLVVCGMVYFASNTGFSSSPMNPFTVVIGQDIAGLQTLSGFGVRSLMFILVNVVVLVYLIKYCNKIKKDPSKSIMGIYKDEAFEEDDANVQIKPAHIINMIILLVVFVIYAYGSIKFNWGLTSLGAYMMILAFATGFIGGMSPNQMAKSFVKGCKAMVYSAMVIGFASGINVILSDAKVIHTLVYYLCLPLQSLPTAISAIGMFISNFLINFCVPSGSAQAYVTMPIMAPAADVLGFSRQIAVSAYQYGDGFCNAVIPTSGLMIGFLGIAGVPYEKWLKWVVPITLILCVIVSVFLIIAVSLGWA